MSENEQPAEDFFFGVMILNSDEWRPHSRYDGSSFGSALVAAEELDGGSGFEAVKIMKIPASGRGEQKEMWISPHLKALSDARAATAFQAGVKQSKQKLEAAHAERKGPNKKT